MLNDQEGWLDYRKGRSEGTRDFGGGTAGGRSSLIDGGTQI